MAISNFVTAAPILFMPTIEIWKSKPLWHTLSLDKRQGLIDRLRQLLEMEQHADAGPYLVPSENGAILVWSTAMRRIQAHAQYADIGLTRYFEPLASTSSTDHKTAKMMADKLRG